MMFLGICIHSAITYMTLPSQVWPFRDRAQSPVCDLLVLFIHVFRMPLFFVLSGFFARMVYQRAGAAEFARHRVKRILLPFIVGLAVLYVPIWTGMMYGANIYGDPGAFVMDGLRSGSFLTPLRTMHLWFLYYLLYLYVGALMLDAVARRIVPPAASTAFNRIFRAIASSPLRALILAVPTCITLYFMHSGSLDTNATFLLTPASLIAYSVFFGFGWFLFTHSDMLPDFRKYAWVQVALAIAILPINIQYTGATMRGLPNYNPQTHTIAIVTGSLIVWLFIFGFLGLAQRYLSRESKHMRYLADASYWMYLVHLPVVVWIQVALVPWQAPALVKFLAALVATTAITLGSYTAVVRYGFIGTALNGPRRRPAALSPAAKAASA